MWTNTTARNTKTPRRCRCRWRTRFHCAVLDPERDWVDGAFDGYSHWRRGQRSVASAKRSRWPRSSMICAWSRQTAIWRHNWWRWDFWVCGFRYIYIYIYFFFFYWCFWFFFAWVFWCLIFFLCNFFFLRSENLLMKLLGFRLKLDWMLRKWGKMRKPLWNPKTWLGFFFFFF